MNVPLAEGVAVLTLILSCAVAFALNLVFSLLAEPWLLGRRSPRSAWIGAALGIAGLAIVLGPGLVVGTDVFRDMTGAVMAREAGSYSLTLLFDDGGDFEPGGTILGEPTITRFSGLHQLATATNEEICASIAAALGG